MPAHNRVVDVLRSFLKHPELRSFLGDREKRASVIVGAVGCLAILGALTVKGYTTENILDAVKDFAGLGAIFVAIVLGFRSVGPRNRREAGESALGALQTEFPNYLSGPTYSSQGQRKKAASGSKNDSEEEELSRYLFFHDERGKNRVNLIPLKQLEDGRIDIRVSGTTLLALGLKHEETTLKRCQELVARAVTDEIRRPPQEDYIIKASAADPGKTEELPERCAIIVDIGNNVRISRFSKIILRTGRTVVNALVSFKESQGSGSSQK